MLLMKSTLVLSVLVLALLISSASARRVKDLDRLLAKDAVRELQWFYNSNMDAAAAVLSTRSRSSPEFNQRVNNVVGVFCPDPEFQGWTATGGVNGGIQMYARKRDQPAVFDPTYQNLSVRTIYRDALPGNIFVNSSQHFVGMEQIRVFYGSDDRLYAEFNATLRQSFNQRAPIPNPPPAAITEVMGHYNNLYVLYTPPGGRRDDAYWCMRKFNSFNAFAFVFNPDQSDPQYVYQLSEQNANNAQLGSDVRPAGPNWDDN